MEINTPLSHLGLGRADLLGRAMRDRITGFRGVATGYVTYISGCNQYLLSPVVDEKGDRRAGEWFDEQRLELVAGADRVVLDNGGGSGPCDPPPDR